MARTIVIHEYGTFLGKHSERLVIRGPSALKARLRKNVTQADDVALSDVKEKRPEDEIPFFQIGEIIVPPRGVTLSSELMLETAQRGITVSFMSRMGKPYALLSSPMLTATAATRREQLRALDDERGATICRNIIAAKLRNQAGLLTYFAKPVKEPARRERMLAAVVTLRKARHEARNLKGPTVDSIRGSLMGIEGAGARAYWDGVSALCEGRVEFTGRKRQGDMGPLNGVLNYGYGILYSRVWGAALNAGLDPFAGFLHTDRPGKPSLVLDLVEDLRAPVVDRAILAYVGLGRSIGFEGNHLDEDTRRAIANVVVERLESTTKHRGKTLRVSSVIQLQVRALATFLRGDGEWRPFTMYW